MSLPKYKILEKSQKHGDPHRFFCQVELEQELIGQGYGGSIKEAEKEAAKNALEKINPLHPK